MPQGIVHVNLGYGSATLTDQNGKHVRSVAPGVTRSNAESELNVTRLRNWWLDEEGNGYYATVSYEE